MALPPDQPWRSRGLWLLRLAFATVVLALVVRSAPLGDVMRRAREASAVPLLLALALAGAGSLVLAIRLRLLARALGLSPTLRAAADVNLSALFYGLFLPGGNVTGGAIRFYRLAGRERRVSAAAGALAWDRLFATLALCLVGLTSWLIAPPPKPNWPVLAFTLGAFAILGLMAIGLLAGRGDPGHESQASGTLARIGRRIRIGVRETVRPRASSCAAALALSILAQVLSTALYTALAAAVGVSVSPATLGWIRGAVMLVLLLPITISGLGLREGTLMVLLAAEGVGEVQAVALGVLIFATTVVAPGLVGGIGEGIRLLRSD